VLFGVSVDIRRGESVALLGTNGAGKSTLLRVVSGLERPSRGSVELDGEDITAVPAEKLPSRGLALVTGGRSVFPDMTVAENLDILALPLRRRKIDPSASRDRVLQLFPRLRERLSQTAGTMSGGEQQQLALARAVLLDPKVLCIDELSLGLSPAIVEDLLGAVRDIHASGTTIIVVEQSLNIAAGMCRRCIFMEKGAIRFEGPTADLLESDEIARAVFLGQRAQGDGSKPYVGVN
jgi:ABC-type branched-subunit amino acid transport system ATPase component